MIHYASQYKMFGPLINYSTLRFEGKHSNLKSIFSTSKNFKNPCLTIATRHQYLQSLHNMNREYLVENKEIFSKNYSKVSFFDLHPQLQQEFLSISNEDEFLLTYKSVEFSGITYQSGTVVVTGYDSEYKFGLIEHVCKIKGYVYLILKKCEVIEFNTHLHAFSLKETETRSVKKIKQLHSPFVLPAYITKLGELVVKLYSFVM